MGDKTIEDGLAEVERLRYKLKAVITHYDHGEYRVTRRNQDVEDWWEIRAPSSWEEPNVEKRKKAEDSLREIVDNHESYYVRYKAAEALEIDEEEIDKYLDRWTHNIAANFDWERIKKSGGHIFVEKGAYHPVRARKDFRKFYNLWSLPKKHLKKLGEGRKYSKPRIFLRTDPVKVGLAAAAITYLTTLAMEVFK